LLVWRKWTQLLRSVVLNVLLILLSLIGQLLVDLFSEIFHELSDSFLNFLVDQVSNSFPHVVGDLVKFFVVLLGAGSFNILLLSH